MYDVGHGGADPGGGSVGIKESDFNLETARLAAGMTRMVGVNVALTRTRDIDLKPSARIMMITAKSLTCVVSVHANAHADLKVRGHEIFVSAFDPRSAALGQAISDQFMSLLSIPARSPAVKTRLTSDEDADYYYVIQEAVQAGIPAVLIEPGFLTNTEDALFLSNFWGQFQVAYAVSRGVVAWLGLDADTAQLELARARLELADAQNRLDQIAVLAGKEVSP